MAENDAESALQTCTQDSRSAGIAPRLLPVHPDRLCFDHGDEAITANQIDFLRRSAAVAARGTNVLPMMGRRRGGLHACAAAGVTSDGGECHGRIGAAHFNLTQGVFVFDYEFKQGVAGFGVAPAVALGASDDQTVGFRFTLEQLVVIHSIVARVLDV